jgi:CRP/FNR family cyclic AMP-dependent transcriptional regulator
VKLTVVNGTGKEAVVGILEPGDFLGEGCLAGRSICMATATAVAPTTVLVIEKNEMIRALHEEPEISDRFIAYVVARNARVEQDLVDQLFNSSEKRLARTLLLLARYGKQDKPPKGASQIIARDARGDDSHNAAPRQFFLEQIQETGLHQVQGRAASERLSPQRCPARLADYERETGLVTPWTDQAVFSSCFIW